MGFFFFFNFEHCALGGSGSPQFFILFMTIHLLRQIFGHLTRIVMKKIFQPLIWLTVVWSVLETNIWSTIVEIRNQRLEVHCVIAAQSYIRSRNLARNFGDLKTSIIWKIKMASKLLRFFHLTLYFKDMKIYKNQNNNKAKHTVL